MKALLIVSMGSRRRESNDEVRLLTERLAHDVGPGIQRVLCAFLEFTEPSIGLAVSKLVADGVTEIITVPLFLVAGAHVSGDIPLLIEKAKARYPDIRFTITPHVGAMDGIGGLILKSLEGLPIGE